jgi:hypothetical protein
LVLQVLKGVSLNQHLSKDIQARLSVSFHEECSDLLRGAGLDSFTIDDECRFLSVGVSETYLQLVRGEFRAKCDCLCSCVLLDDLSFDVCLQVKEIQVHWVDLLHTPELAFFFDAVPDQRPRVLAWRVVERDERFHLHILSTLFRGLKGDLSIILVCRCEYHRDARCTDVLSNDMKHLDVHLLQILESRRRLGQGVIQSRYDKSSHGFLLLVELETQLLDVLDELARH